MKKVLYITLMISLVSCSFIPTYQRPPAKMPSAWQNETKEKNKKMVAVTAKWWTNFASEELNQFIHEALCANNDLKSAFYRIEQARANSLIAGAPLLPNVEATGGTSLIKTFSGSSSSSLQNSSNAQLSVAYEVDLWGKNRAALLAANYLVASSAYDYATLSLITSADVAQTYFEILTLREQIRIGEQNIANANDVLNIISAQFREGRTSQLELSQQKSVQATQLALVAALRKLEINRKNKLAILLGRNPEDLNIKGKRFHSLTIPNISPIQPSLLLQRRPDISRAEADLLSANANIGVARAAFFPQLNLNADASIITNPMVKAITLSASTIAPIFTGGLLEGQLAFANAVQKELAAQYLQTVLISLQEVEDAFAAIKIAKQRENLLRTAAKQARMAYSLSRERFLAGSIDFQTVINTQSEQLRAEEGYALAHLETLSAHVLLFKALGGGWCHI